MIYVYKCPNDHVTECFQAHDTGHIVCPQCAKLATKIPATTNFILKGSGWAKDGYSK